MWLVADDLWGWSIRLRLVTVIIIIPIMLNVKCYSEDVGEEEVKVSGRKRCDRMAASVTAVTASHLVTGTYLVTVLLFSYFARVPVDGYVA